MEIVEKDLPQLIVALDSLNDDANYIHILDAKENTNYYCPCCKGIVKPRAYKKDKDYQVQAHYYHETGGCNDETFVHYICKNWLFEKGCKFVVNDVQYEVENIEVEKTLHTSFGDYRPDIIVITTVAKVFYFEIKTTNKKTELYAPKWDELGNDVVEVDTRYFINQKYKNDIPVFNLIYSDGECFIKSYSKNDYEDIIAKRKLEWKRQDKLNYKIQWERLDWFWENIRRYKSKQCLLDDVEYCYKLLDYKDKVWIYQNIRDKSCFDLKNIFIEILNSIFINWLDILKKTYESDILHVEYKKHSKTIYKFWIDYYNEGYKRTVFTKSFRSKRNVWFKEDLEEIQTICSKNMKILDDAVLKIHKLEKLYFVKNISPTYSYAKTTYDIKSIYFSVVYHANVYNKYIKNTIGTDSYLRFEELTEKYLEKRYKYFLVREQENFQEKWIYNNILYNNYKFLDYLNRLEARCKSEKGFYLDTSDKYKRIKLYYHNSSSLHSSLLIDWEFKDEYIFGEFEDKFYNSFINKIDSELLITKNNKVKKSKITRIVNKLGKQINECKNKYWTFRLDSKKRWVIGFLGRDMIFEPAYDTFPDDNLEEYIKAKITEAMIISKNKSKDGLPYYDNRRYCTIYPTIRIMEE